MNKKSLYYEASKKFPEYSQNELIEFENFFTKYGLNFIFDINQINKKFKLGSRGLNFDTGRDYIKQSNDFLFCLTYYYGPNIKILEEEIEKSNFKNNKEAIFNYLKKKQYIFSIKYHLFLTGGEKRVNVVFGSKKGDGLAYRLTLNLLNQLLTKIFKIILVDDAFKLKNAAVIDVIGNEPSKNILYRKFLIKYLQNKPYRLAGAEDKRAKRGLTIIPIGSLAEYGKNFLEDNKNVEMMIRELEKLHSQFSNSIKIIVFKYLNFKKNNQINKLDKNTKKINFIKEIEALENDKNKRKQIIEIYDFLMKKKTEIEKEIMDKKYNVSLYKFLSDHLDYGTSRNGILKYKNNKILKIDRYEKNKNFLSNYVSQMLILGEYAREKKIDFKVKRDKEITPEEIINRIEKIKKHIKDPLSKFSNSIEKIKNETVLLKEKIKDMEDKNKEEMKRLDKEQGKILDDRNYHNDDNLQEQYRKLRDEEFLLRKPVEELKDKFYEKEKEAQELEDKNKYINNINNASDAMINFFKNKEFETIISKYGYKNFKKFILDIGKNNILHKEEIRKLFLEHKLIKNQFLFYLELII